jgi:hypothetical protein
MELNKRKTRKLCENLIGSRRRNTGRAVYSTELLYRGLAGGYGNYSMGGVAAPTQMISFLFSTLKLLVEAGMALAFSFGVFLGVAFLLGALWDATRKWLNK